MRACSSPGCIVTPSTWTSRRTRRTIDSWSDPSLIWKLGPNSPWARSTSRQKAWKVMQRQGRGGSIVNIMSISAHGGQPFITAYCASKGALATLTKNVAYSQRQHRIRVNGLNIGWMATPAEDAVQKEQGSPADWLERADAGANFGRIIRPHDVAQLTAYLFSDDSLMMTGAVIDFNDLVIGAFD